MLRESLTNQEERDRTAREIERELREIEECDLRSREREQKDKETLINIKRLMTILSINNLTAVVTKFYPLDNRKTRRLKQIGHDVAKEGWQVLKKIMAHKNQEEKKDLYDTLMKLLDLAKDIINITITITELNDIVAKQENIAILNQKIHSMKELRNNITNEVFDKPNFFKKLLGILIILVGVVGIFCGPAGIPLSSAVYNYSITLGGAVLATCGAATLFYYRKQKPLVSSLSQLENLVVKW